MNLAQISQPSRTAALTRELREETAQLLRAGGTEELLELRALQAELFLDEVRRWAETGEEQVELRELGSDFTRVAESSWLDSNRRLLLDDDDLRLLFRIRWGQLTGVHRRQPFGPDLEEFRRYYLRMLEHPPGARDVDPTERAFLQIPTVLALGELDPDYPKDLAHGILLLKTGQAEAATQALTQHLTSSPDGPWTQLAQNYRLAALRASTPF